jgi:hypothetical protein
LIKETVTMDHRAFSLCIAGVLSAAGAACGSSNTTAPAAGGHAGTYAATYSGTYAITSPPGLPGGSNTASGTIVITDLPGGGVAATFQIPPNPASGEIDFALSGETGNATSPATGGMCFVGQVNGNTQSNCCTACSIAFDGNMFTQPNAGTFTGTTPSGSAYSGTYTGTWVGTKE